MRGGRKRFWQFLSIRSQLLGGYEEIISTLF